ncbi:MAG TPA: (2Fe-2S)-binding protein [Cellvibrionaceae bacterium]|nr:(2Fe-2S)-binding protein [Cellvibrionaceae bacterium]
MYVCLCHAVTERQVAEAIEKGARCIKDLRAQLSITATCGKCASCARECIQNKVGKLAQASTQNDLIPMAEAS